VAGWFWICSVVPVCVEWGIRGGALGGVEGRRIVGRT